MASVMQNIRSVQITPFYFKDTDSLKDSGSRLLLRIFFSGFAWIQKTYIFPSIYIYIYLSISPTRLRRVGCSRRHSETAGGRRSKRFRVGGQREINVADALFHHEGRRLFHHVWRRDSSSVKSFLPRLHSTPRASPIAAKGEELAQTCSQGPCCHEAAKVLETLSRSTEVREFDCVPHFAPIHDEPVPAEERPLHQEASEKPVQTRCSHSHAVPLDLGHTHEVAPHQEETALEFSVHCC